MKLQVYEFTLVLDGVDDKTPNLEDALFEAGCDDALINFRNGTVYLDFDREENSLEDAVYSAIHMVEKSELHAKVVRVLPNDIVSISDIAKRLNTDRQRVSQWVKGERRSLGAPFPSPILNLSEKSAMWRWYSVVQWLSQQRLIDDIQLVDQAKFLDNINAILDERDPEIKKYRHGILRKLENHTPPDRTGGRVN